MEAIPDWKESRWIIKYVPSGLGTSQEERVGTKTSKTQINVKKYGDETKTLIKVNDMWPHVSL